jgi:hypothetical protein
MSMRFLVRAKLFLKRKLDAVTGVLLILSPYKILKILFSA